jgi:peptidoglycan/LPS O-acetylase OafA/YrhL
VIIGLACLVGGLMMAELGYRFIERPMIQRGRSWANATQRA